ncbi:MAG TPA: hypothetical protein EYF95_00770 [Flavobacteriales bacterium]|jgi:hypothetical protein|nr:hypothetical protein [Flavobacteriales bacterium]
MADYYSKLSKKNKKAFNKLEIIAGVAHMERNPEYKKKILDRAKKAKKKALIKKVKNKGHVTHGSKYQKLKSGMKKKK